MKKILSFIWNHLSKGGNFQTFICKSKKKIKAEYHFPSTCDMKASDQKLKQLMTQTSNTKKRCGENPSRRLCASKR